MAERIVRTLDDINITFSMVISSFEQNRTTFHLQLRGMKIGWECL